MDTTLYHKIEDQEDILRARHDKHSARAEGLWGRLDQALRGTFRWFGLLRSRRDLDERPKS